VSAVVGSNVERIHPFLPDGAAGTDEQVEGSDLPVLDSLTRAREVVCDAVIAIIVKGAALVGLIEIAGLIGVRAAIPIAAIVSINREARWRCGSAQLLGRGGRRYKAVPVRIGEERPAASTGAISAAAARFAVLSLADSGTIAGVVGGRARIRILAGGYGYTATSCIA
jgi:hypothetical protein